MLNRICSLGKRRRKNEFYHIDEREFFEILFEELRCEPFYEKEPESLTKNVKNATDKRSTTTTLTFSASAAGLSPPLRINKEESVGCRIGDSY
jgi:hypothetical protein